MMLYILLLTKYAHTGFTAHVKQKDRQQRYSSHHSEVFLGLKVNFIY